MSEKRGFFGRMLQRRGNSAPEIQTDDARGITGALDSFGKRQAALRIEKEMSAAERAYTAATAARLARADYVRACEHLQPESIEAIQAEERARIAEQRLNQEVRLATAQREAQRFELKADAEDARARAELLAAQLAEQEARRALEGFSAPPPSIADTTVEQRSRLLEQMSDVEDKLSEIYLEHASKVADNAMDEATEQRLQSKIN
ncbi:MAG: hypothetical protein AAF709_18820 [Pseudomonadota bacterium]